MSDHDDLPQPIGRPQGGLKSDAGRAAYWRMQYESAIGALADLIAEHTEQRAVVAEEIAAAIEAPIPALLDELEKGRASERADAAAIARRIGGTP